VKRRREKYTEAYIKNTVTVSVTVVVIATSLRVRQSEVAIRRVIVLESGFWLGAKVSQQQW
jgi:hypothetical protein